MWKVLVVAAVLETALGASIYHCPEGSPCETSEGHLETTSFDFLSKFSEKQLRAIVHLKISDALINKVDPRLKYLKNLSYLDLSHNNVQISSIPSLNSLKTLILKGNNLKSINLTALPQNVEVIDISHNLLTQIPRDWISLKYLKTLHLYKNPIDCDCNNVLNYDRLIKGGVSVPEPITCHSPSKYVGKDITAISCSIDDIMVYDEPLEGSGDTDIFDESANMEMHKVPFVEEKEDEILEDNTISIVDDKVENSAAEEEEGSGDEGSGFGILPDTGVLGCIENCSTPGPVGENDEEYASAPPSVLDQAMILFHDINPFAEPTPSSSTSTKVTTPTTSSFATTSTAAPVPVVEPNVLKETGGKLFRQSDKSDDVEEIANGTRTGELERASAAPSDSTAVYAIVGVGMFLAVLFVIAFVKGRRSKRRQEKRDANSFGEEMKPLSKLSISAPTEKPAKKSNIPENVPLINGQNGKTKDDAPVLTSFTPLAHPEQTKDEIEEDGLQQNGYNSESDEVDIRPKAKQELLTPQRERVTIRESQIPESIPKTPVLVQRKKNSEGEIVTTVVP